MKISKNIHKVSQFLFILKWGIILQINHFLKKNIKKINYAVPNQRVSNEKYKTK